MEKFDALLSEGEKEMEVLVSMIETSGVLANNLFPPHFDLQSQFLTAFHNRTFNVVKGHPLFSQLAIFASYYTDPSHTYTTQIAWVAWVAFLADIMNGGIGNRTLYACHLVIAPDELEVSINISQVDQRTGNVVLPLLVGTEPISKYTLKTLPSGWMNVMRFNPYTGQVELSLQQNLEAQNGTWIQPDISVSASTVSDELRSQLSETPNDRLVLFFRQPHGYMIAASHGKYFSHSDMDRRFINPLVNPPNISAYRLWTCLQSNDALIQEACQQLYDTYGSWVAIPALHLEMVLNGQRYWVATGYSSGSLQCTVLMLKNRASVMGNVDASNQHVDQSVSDKKGITVVILGVVGAVAVLLPLAVGLWLSSRLHKLAEGMDRIAQLQFTTTPTSPTIFRELHRFQSSFTQMERGLHAFGKFVPQAVVKVLIDGRMKAINEMHSRVLSIMFADIEGFTTVCENESPTTLVLACTEYFEAMCGGITQHNGTIDKFIGDCIMAIWNAPDCLPGHERDAVAASLAMQNSVIGLHAAWQKRGMPILKFRLGIHTGMCLVGNFGCSFRISYTCLGDGVNLAARLEALNKKFGTHICVSHATFEGCCDDFHFRKLAKVTVPGKSEVLPVYEVLCEADDQENTKTCSLGVTHPPGTVNLDVRPSPRKGQKALSDVPEAMDLSPTQRRYIKVCSPLLADTVELTFEKPQPGQVAFHWMYVDQLALLHQSTQYEQAYEAMVAGDLVQARQLLTARPLLDLPDKAWAALADQLEHTEEDEPWDGVFYFREK
eukprot:GGOE01062907.1.p1 GENE.GGOE01062907.1~~GGOE01062907.1.p1  ORF type:complete len:845 (-),score=261.53 GGOE01062907.1:829-3159(-)